MIDLSKRGVMKNILCFGDSNTYGRIPLTKSGERFERNQRWPGILNNMLGEEYHIIEEGLGGRTSVISDQVEGIMSGLEYITPCLRSHAPLDLVIVQLGTNDMKARYSLSPVDVALGVERVISTIFSTKECKEAKVLALVPLYINDVNHFKFHEMFEGGDIKSRKLSPLFFDMENRYENLWVLDPSPSISSSKKDGIHLDLLGHKAMASLVFDKVKEIGL